MPNETDTQEERSLDESVGELLSQFEADAAKEEGAYASSVAAPPPPPGAGGALPDTPEPEPEVEADVTESTGEEDPGAVPETESKAPQEEPPLPEQGESAGEPAAVESAQVEGEQGARGKAVAEETETPTQATEEAPSGEDSLNSLDAQLAGVADGLMEDGSAEPPRPSRAPFMPAVAALRPDVYGPRPTKPAPEQQQEQTATEPAGKEAAAARESVLSVWMARAGDYVAELAYAALQKVSAPLDSRPPQVRSAIGVIAAFNFFLVACVWGYVLFVRSDVPVPPAEGARATHVADVVSPVDRAD